MSYVCDICGKKTVSGVTSAHHRGIAGKRWKKRAQETKRKFVPNLQAASVVIDGKLTKVKICTKCLKKYRTSRKPA